MIEGPKNQTESRTFAKQEWFDAYYRGNSLVPQSGAGIAVCLLDSVIDENGKTEWSSLIKSELSPEQLTFLGNSMSAMHKAKGIKVSTENRKHIFTEEPKVIGLERIQKLWKSAVFATAVSLVPYIYPDRDDVSLEDINQTNYIELTKVFFANPDNSEKIKELKVGLSEISKLFQEPEAVEILKEYGREFMTERPQAEQDSVWYNKKYGAKLGKILFPRLRRALGDNMSNEFLSFLESFGLVSENRQN